MEDHIPNLSDYLYQRMGGPCYYGQRKGFALLLSRHTRLPITTTLAETWLDLFEESLEEHRDRVSDAARYIILDFLRFTAYFIIAGQQIEAKMRAQSTHFGEVPITFEV